MTEIEPVMEPNCIANNIGQGHMTLMGMHRQPLSDSAI